MVSNFALLYSLVLVSFSLATPSSRLEARLARRRENRQSKSLAHFSESGIEPNVVYDDMWTGVTLNGNSGTLTSISGTFTVPTPSGISGAAACAWVGIDGGGCSHGLLQAGVDFLVADEGVSYDAWYEWYPNVSYDFPGVDVHTGDVITVNVTAFSTTSGIAILENHTTRQRAEKVIHSSYALCQFAAEWIVEDFYAGNTQLPFADFGSVTFTDAVAAGPSGRYTPCDATNLELGILDIKRNGQVDTPVAINGCNVTIKYA